MSSPEQRATPPEAAGADARGEGGRRLGEAAFAALFLVSAGIGVFLGDQPGLTVFCAVIGLAAAGFLATSRALRARAVHPSRASMTASPRRWGLRSWRRPPPGDTSRA